jgi:hypothetical protein
MSLNIPQHYILQYNADVQLAYQFAGGKLAPLVQSNNHQGEGAAPADFVGPTQANLNPGRLAPTPVNNASVTRRWVYPNYFDHAFYIAKQDVSRVFSGGKLQAEYAQSQGKAMARLRDDLLLSTLFTTATTGKNAGSTVSFPSSNIVAPNYKAAANTGLKVAKLIRAKKILRSNGVDLENAKLVCAINSDDEEFLLNQIEIRSKDYNDKAVLVDGKLTSYLGISFIPMEYTDAANYPNASAANVSGGTRYVGLFDAMAVYWGNWQAPQTDVAERKDLSNAIQMYAWAEGGPTRLQEGGVVRIDCV